MIQYKKFAFLASLERLEVPTGIRQRLELNEGCLL